MTEQQFDARLAHIEEQYRARREGADAYRDQEVARLFGECGWSQERIAARMGKRQVWVSQRLCFGRFLSFIATGDRTANLTERRFRGHWKRTKGPERQRFASVLEALEHGVPHGKEALRHKPGVRKALVEALADGRAYTAAQLTAAVEESLPGVTEDQVSNAARQLVARPPEGQQVRAKKIGRHCQYRMTGAGPRPATPTAALYDKVAPLLDELEEMSRRHTALLSPVLVGMIATKLRRLFESVLEEATA